MTPRVARVLVTRAANQAAPLADALRAVGLEPVVVPAIAVELDARNGSSNARAPILDTNGWVVVTSANGARAIVAARARTWRRGGGPRFAAVGGATASVLERAGMSVDFQPSAANAGALAEELPVQPGEVVLLVRGDAAGGSLPERLRERGARVTDTVGYRTIEAPPRSRALLRQAFDAGSPAAIVLASGSAARGLVALGRIERLDVTSVPAVCIGPETAGEATANGFRVAATAPRRDVASLAAATAAAVRLQEEP